MANDPNKSHFWVDGALVEWLLVPFENFGWKGRDDPKEQLEAYFKYDTDYLKNQANLGHVRLLAFNVYDLNEEIVPDRRTHYFRIWEAILGKNGDETPQYWIMTNNNKGIVVLTLIQGKAADATRVKVLIDSYMANFGAVNTAS